MDLAREQSIYLFNNIKRANFALKDAAMKGQAFAKKFTTPSNLIKDLYRQYDTKSKIVDPISRLVFMLSITNSIEDDEINAYFNTPGSLLFLCNFVSEAAGYIGQKDYKTDEFSELELEVIKITKEYEATLKAFGYIELCECAKFLSEKLNSKFNIFAKDNLNVYSPTKELIDHLSKNGNASKQVEEIAKYKDSLKNKDLTICELSGKEAFASALREVLKENRAAQNVLLLTSDPDVTFYNVATILREENIDFNIEVKTKRHISSTYFGKALVAISEILDDSFDISLISDLMRNPIMNLNYYDINEKDAHLRSCIVKIDEEVSKVVEFIESNSRAYQLIYDIFSKPITSTKNTLDELKKLIISNKNLSQFDKHLEINAIKTIDQIADLLFKIGINKLPDIEFLDLSTTKTSYSFNIGNSDKTMTIASVSSSSGLAPMSFDMVICDDVSSLAFSASSKLDSLNSLLSKLDLKPTLTPVEKVRDNFISMLDASRKNVTLMMPKRDLDLGCELYPSFTLQEMSQELSNNIDYKSIPENVSDLTSFKIIKFNESEISSNVGLNSSSNVSGKSRKVSTLKYSLTNSDKLAKFLSSNVSETGELIMSPSSIETYVQCPYKWFMSYVIKAKNVDKEFSPSDAGNICHLAFKNFYDKLYQKNIYRLNTPDEVVSHQELFKSSFHKAAKELYGIDVFDYGSQDIYLEDVTINLKLNKLARTCVNSLLAQIFIPKDYVVLESEFKIDPKDEINYAGARIAGRVDRIDVNKKEGSFLVIDYKGNIENHDAGFSVADAQRVTQEKELFMPNKTQALIYASCIAKKINMTCDGAIYLTYNEVKGGKLPASGTISIKVADGFQDIINLNKCSCHIEMSDYLDFIEAQIELKLNELKSGNIKPNPLNQHVCKYCEVEGCPFRR